MVHLRAQKIQNVVKAIAPLEIDGPNSGGLLVLGWGSTYLSIHSAVRSMSEEGHSVSHVHVRHLNPLPSDLGDILKRFKRVLIPELNMGQFRLLIRSKYLIDAIGLNKIQGRPFLVSEFVEKILQILDDLIKE